jgi:hypothetical protein
VTRLEGKGPGVSDRHRRMGTEYKRYELLDRMEAQPFDEWSPARLRALVAVFELNGATPAAPHDFRPYVVKEGVTLNCFGFQRN